MPKEIIIGVAKEKIQSGETLCTIIFSGIEAKVVSNVIKFRPWGKTKVLNRVLMRTKVK